MGLLEVEEDVYGEDVEYVAFELGCYRLSGDGLTEYKGTYSVLWIGTEVAGSEEIQWSIHRDILNHVD